VAEKKTLRLPPEVLRGLGMQVFVENGKKKGRSTLTHI
jgi:hypothetical protein